MRTEALSLVRAIKAIPTEAIPKWKVLEAINEALAAPAAEEKRAPVQGYPGGIPWAIHLEAYEVYCKRYGSQQALIDLEGRNCRGGFSTGELDEFIPGWRERVAEFGKLKAEVEQLRAQLAAQAPQPIQDEREALRAAQAEAVMPLIGPLLDAWENTDMDTMSEEPELSKWLRAINKAMEEAGITKEGAKP